MAKRNELTPIEKEFADFVETYDTAEMIEKGELTEVQDVRITPPARKASITMKIYPALLNRIQRIASLQQIPYQSLIYQWLAERTYFEEYKTELGREDERAASSTLAAQND